jgi:outer membrane protein OmpA-like peptidoglycan-associated protein
MSAANAMSWSPLQSRSAGLLQRKCACGGAAGMSGECETCKKKKRLSLQTTLKVNEPGDIYEREADGIADQVMAAFSSPAVSGGPPRIQRFSGYSNGRMDWAHTSVDQALASPGRLLEPTLRQDMEQRFGYDFSGVRVHTDAAAEQSAREVSAHAYTVGQDVVFGAGRFAPRTQEGRRLIAHELTHVLQQQEGVPFVQRAPAGGGPSTVALTIGDVDIKSSDPNCEYQKGEAERSRTPRGILEYDIEKAEFFGIEPRDAVVIADFKVDDPELRPSAERDLRKYWIPTFDKSSLGSLEIVGFNDCVGWEKRNKSIRDQRARSVARLLPGVSTSSADFDEYLVPNTSDRGRALNRSVIIRHKQKPPPPPPKKRETTIKMEEPATKNCSPEQRRQLSIAFPAAKLMAERAKAAVFSPNKGPVINFLLERYFGGDVLAHLPEIHAGFSKILSNWTDWDSRFDCEIQTEEGCRLNDPHLIALGAFVGAYVTNKRGAVHVCERAFGSPDDMQQLSASILHELSHRLDNTDDKKYCWPQEGWCSSLSIEAAIDNADSYAQFARDIFNSSI